MDTPNTRFTKADNRYKLVNGAEIAESWADLTDGSLNFAIQINEYGNIVVPNQDDWWIDSLVFTGTDYKGDRLINFAGAGTWLDHCYQWTMQIGLLQGTAPMTSKTSSWTQYGYRPEGECEAARARLYCFQQ
jgi:hypothetical protein